MRAERARPRKAQRRPAFPLVGVLTDSGLSIAAQAPGSGRKSEDTNIEPALNRCGCDPAWINDSADPVGPVPPGRADGCPDLVARAGSNRLPSGFSSKVRQLSGGGAGVAMSSCPSETLRERQVDGDVLA